MASTASTISGVSFFGESSIQLGRKRCASDTEKQLSVDSSLEFELVEELWILR